MKLSDKKGFSNRDLDLIRMSHDFACMSPKELHSLNKIVRDKFQLSPDDAARLTSIIKNNPNSILGEFLIIQKSSFPHKNCGCEQCGGAG